MSDGALLPIPTSSPRSPDPGPVFQVHVDQQAHQGPVFQVHVAGLQTKETRTRDHTVLGREEELLRDPTQRVRASSTDQGRGRDCSVFVRVIYISIICLGMF